MFLYLVNVVICRVLEKKRPHTTSTGIFLLKDVSINQLRSMSTIKCLCLNNTSDAVYIFKIH